MVDAAPTPAVVLATASATMAELRRSLLVRDGWDVTVVADGEEAWTALSASPQRFVAVVADSVLPGLSGGQLVQRLRASSGPLHSMAVVMVGTSPPDDEDVAIVGQAHGQIVTAAGAATGRTLGQMVEAAIEQQSQADAPTETR